MKGSTCRCGYSTNAVRIRCPRCGKQMTEASWEDTGIVISCASTPMQPEEESEPMHVVLVGISAKGPQIICWAAECPQVGDDVVVSRRRGMYLAEPKKGQTTGSPVNR